MTIALITGGSRGIGRSAALALADKGTDVIITFKSNEKEAKNTVALIEKKGRKALALSLDVGKSGSFEGFAGEVKKILKAHFSSERFDFLVNNAGTGLHVPFAETTEVQFDELMNVHLKGPYFLTQKLLPLIADGGRILNISSGLARFSFPGASAYAMMKGGIEVFTRYLAKELGARGISTNTVAPGAIATDFNGGRVRDNKEMNAMIASNTALGRAGLPDDIGELVAMLLAPESRWVNAQRIEASGGMLI